jgi:hypothetical protein
MPLRPLASIAVAECKLEIQRAFRRGALVMDAPTVLYSMGMAITRDPYAVALPGEHVSWSPNIVVFGMTDEPEKKPRRRSVRGDR